MMEFSISSPFVTHMGFELMQCDNGQSEIAYEARPEHLNSFGVTHGGACMTLLDITMSNAARSVQTDMGMITIEMKTSFMQAASGKLLAKGRLMHRTATLAFTEATIVDERGRICAHATATFKYVRRLPTGPKSANPLNVSSGH